MLVRRLFAKWITKTLIQMVKIRTTAEILAARKLETPKFSYIPDRMPPRDVPNCKFLPPQTDTWKLEHRQVTFFHQSPHYHADR